MGTLTQTAFRFRNDDGSETTATWLAGLNTNVFLRTGAIFRIRIEVTDSGSGTFFLSQLQYNKNAAGWNNVTTVSSVVKAISSANVTDGISTTQQLSVGGSFADGEYSEDGIIDNDNFLFDTRASEDEFLCQIVSSDVSLNDAIELRISDNGAGLSGGANVTPKVTIAVFPPMRQGYGRYNKTA